MPASSNRAELRIAQVAPAYVHPYSGVLTVLTHLAAALAGRGLDVEVWRLSRWTGEAMAPFRAELDAAGVDAVDMPVAGHFRLGRSAAAAIAARTPDVVHVHNVFNLPNALTTRRLAAPYVVSPHGGYAFAALAHHRWRKGAFRRFVEMPMLRRAAAVCALTEVEAEEVRRFGVAGSVAVVGNGVLPAGDTNRRAFRQDLGIDDDPLAVFVGRLDLYHKGIDQLMAAVAEAPHWHVALIGPDFRDGRKRLQSMAADLGVSDRVHLSGPRRDAALDEAYAAADVFALPSRWEGYPVALLEAAAAGIPALVSPAVEERIAVAAAGAGRVVPPGQWGGALRDLGAATTGEIAGLRAAARAFAADRSWDRVAGRYEELYRNVVSAARG